MFTFAFFLFKICVVYAIAKEFCLKVMFGRNEMWKEILISVEGDICIWFVTLFVNFLFQSFWNGPICMKHLVTLGVTFGFIKNY